ncbi:MAG TPA: type I-MYXAN CRISPR-associated protein Cas5/Cmx5/DevS [Pirellulales bacterium]|nr:type I-MYXAN CRISPR-associated protein Cas5/Cmx5/DevS [Pirellulales bacterium]
MLVLYVEAPFAVFRTFTAGWYRPTATFITPSAAYGLVLNLAGIDSRLREDEPGHGGKVPASLTRPGLPAMEIAVGVPEYMLRGRTKVPIAVDVLFPRVQTVFQQLHNYPVGTSGAARAESTKGNKYNIAPVRREYLSGFRAVIALRADDDLTHRVVRGIAGDFSERRYGVPFIGDNAFLIDRIETLPEPGPVRWYERVIADPGSGPRGRTTRLTTLIDRADLSRTASALYAPQSEACIGEPPQLAWTTITPPAMETPATPARKPSRRGKN